MSTDVSSVDNGTPTIANAPTGQSSTTSLNITIGGSILSYSYFVGTGAVDCTSGSYNGPNDLTVPITDDITSLPQGLIYVCVIGQKMDGTWQTTNQAMFRSWTKDTMGPMVASVTSTTTDGTFQNGALINLRLTFNEGIHFSAGSGDFRVKLATGQNDDYASTSTSATDVTMLDLYYIVDTDDLSLDLNFDTSMAPVLYSDATIKDAAGNNLQLSALSTGMYLSNSKNIKLVGTPAQLIIMDPDAGAPFDFGTRYVSSVFVKTFELTNPASSVVSANISNSAFVSAAFTFAGGGYPGIGGTCGTTIPPGAGSCTIKVSFSSAVPVNLNSKMTLTYDNGVDPFAILDKNLSAVAIMPWESTSDTNAPAQRVGHTIVQAGAKVIVWGGRSTSTYLDTGAIFDPVTNSWTAIPGGGGAPAGRAYHTAIWTGTEMIIWGGQGTSGTYLNSGAKYNPSTQVWSSMVTGPAARMYHTAVWTGSEMLIWGGFSGAHLASGGSYNPGSNTWTAINSASEPTPRSKHTAVWTGTKMIIWGGVGGIGAVDTGGIYNPAGSSWTATSTTTVPVARYGHAAVWAGSRMIIWGGYNGSSHLDTGANFDPDASANGIWDPMNNTNAPSGRADMAYAWTGAKLIIWSGYDGSFLNTGGVYDPLAGAGGDWYSTNMIGVPAHRTQSAAVWTGNKFFVWGGSPSASPIGMSTGGMYTPLPN